MGVKILVLEEENFKIVQVFNLENCSNRVQLGTMDIASLSTIKLELLKIFIIVSEIFINLLSKVLSWNK